MTFKDFNTYQEALLQKVLDMTHTKGREYAHDDEDRFANFKRAAAKKNLTPLQVASVHMDKHLDAIDSYIIEGKVFSGEGIEGRIVDAITYLTLIAGMIREREVNEEEDKRAEQMFHEMSYKKGLAAV